MEPEAAASKRAGAAEGAATPKRPKPESLNPKPETLNSDP